METNVLEISQMLQQHPIIGEKDDYKNKYLSVLGYFVQKYSADDPWANLVLDLYVNKLLGSSLKRLSPLSDLQFLGKNVAATRFKPFEFYSYRYALLADCIFINAFQDRFKGEQILSEILPICHKRYREKFQRLYNFMYDPTLQVSDLSRMDYLSDCCRRNRIFLASTPKRIMVTATMSAGKSTLLNALCGKKITKTQNEVCTAKLHYIKNKAFEDSLCYEFDGELELDANRRILMEDSNSNTSDEITVGTCFRTLGRGVRRVWLIDTPGVNSSRNVKHKWMTEDAIESTDVDLLIYVLNGENIGTTDDRNHLLFVSENYHGKILFVANKMDRYKKKEDSIQGTLEKAAAELEELGFKNPDVVPVSSYAAYLAKMSIFGEILDEEEQEALHLMSRKFSTDIYQLDTYYPEEIRDSIRVTCDTIEKQVLLHSGLLHLEQMIYSMEEEK